MAEKSKEFQLNPEDISLITGISPQFDERRKNATFRPDEGPSIPLTEKNSRLIPRPPRIEDQ